MTDLKQYFFCGIGGSGMLPLAMIVLGQGHTVSGSDRSRDQGLNGTKFDYLSSLGINLYPQDGSGLVSADQILVVSAAVEDTVPDVAAANKLGCARKSRAELLSELFNETEASIAVGGTSGKSTTTAMIAWIFHYCGKSPTVMNGAVMKNFVTPDALFASAVLGGGETFISEVDESDGSIDLFEPKISILNNIALDHKSMEELLTLFTSFVQKAEYAVINLDNSYTAKIAKSLGVKATTYSLDDHAATLCASNLKPQRNGISFKISKNILSSEREEAQVLLKMPGRHNVSNALAAVAAAEVAGISLKNACAALNKFEGVKRRFEVVGEAADITVIDDFGHNPDKIGATLKTLHDFPGRLLVLFQPHGFGPLRKMKREFIECFGSLLRDEDILIMPEPVYFGGTVDRSVSSTAIVDGVRKQGIAAHAFADRQACGIFIQENVRSNDRIVVMGARDDTLSIFAQDLFEKMVKNQ